MKYFHATLITTFFLLMPSCSFINLDPKTYLEMNTTPIKVSSMSLSFYEDMYYDDGPRNPTVRMGIPKGKYELEAENASFYYFKSPRGIQNTYYIGQSQSTREPLTSSKMVNGGICIPKNPINKTYYAGVYLTKDTYTRVLVFKLGSNFSVFKGSKWQKNF